MLLHAVLSETALANGESCADAGAAREDAGGEVCRQGEHQAHPAPCTSA